MSPLPLPRSPLQALSYAGGFGKGLLPHVVEREIVQDDGSVVKRLDSSMGVCRTATRTLICTKSQHGVVSFMCLSFSVTVN